MNHIMNYKLILYVVFTFVAAFGVSAINFNGWIRSGKRMEAIVLALSLTFSLGYLLTNFVLEFLNI